MTDFYQPSNKVSMARTSSLSDAHIEATEIWVGTHRFGEPSSIQASGIDDIGEFNDWCGIAN